MKGLAEACGWRFRAEESAHGSPECFWLLDKRVVPTARKDDELCAGNASGKLPGAGWWHLRVAPAGEHQRLRPHLA
jgi:hypothetical protein